MLPLNAVRQDPSRLTQITSHAVRPCKHGLVMHRPHLRDHQHTCQIGSQEVQLLLGKQGVQALHNVDARAYAEDANSCNEGPDEFVPMVPIGVQGGGRSVRLHDACPEERLHKRPNGTSALSPKPDPITLCCLT